MPFPAVWQVGQQKETMALAQDANKEAQAGQAATLSRAADSISRSRDLAKRAEAAEQVGAARKGRLSCSEKTMPFFPR